VANKRLILIRAKLLAACVRPLKVSNVQSKGRKKERRKEEKRREKIVMLSTTRSKQSTLFDVSGRQWFSYKTNKTGTKMSPLRRILILRKKIKKKERNEEIKKKK
jgi:hypothetical protein